ncbi:MAG: DUF4252 domain-containing protein [Flavobacteriaceae bacterium]
MKNIQLRAVLCVLMTSFLFSCSDMMSLQKYYVEKTEDADFIIVNLLIDLQQFLKDELTPEELVTMESIRKLNVLIFKGNDQNATKMEREIRVLDQIISQKQYNSLTDFGMLKTKGKLVFLGTEDKIDEGVVYVRNQDMGLAVVRILGKDMNPSALLLLTNKINKADFISGLGSQIEGLFNTLEKVEADKKISLDQTL